MARKLQRDAFGGFNHVLARGNSRATIFQDDADCRAIRSVWSAMVHATA
jgi:hypothetical protein